MKIGIITMQGICNYGSVLQALATQILFEKEGIDVIIFNYLRDNSTIKNILEKATKNDGVLKSFLKKIVLYPSLLLQKKVFGKFNYKNLNLTKAKYYTENDFEKNLPNVDIYCVGSDQVWNYSRNMGYRPELFLQFVPNDKVRVSFSSSIGSSEFNKSEVESVRRELIKFKRISVRETSAILALKEIGIEDVEHIVDPTLLIDKLERQRFAFSKRIINKKYILVYQLNHNKEFDKFAEKFATEKGAVLIRICYRFDQLRLNGKHIIIPKVEKFLRLFMDADYIITDSFHATAFALNLNKKVLSIYPDKFSSRINDLLVSTHSEYMHIDNYDIRQVNDDKYDFSYVNEYLIKQRNAAKKYIKSIIDEYNLL